MKSMLVQEIRDFSSLEVIDVRDPFEYQFGTIPGAKRIPMQEIPEQVHSLKKSQTYYIICQSGSRSNMVCQYLAQNGFDVVNLMGGMGSYVGPLE